MKPEALQTLVTARILFERAEEMCRSDDSHVASAGAVILHDAMELVFRAVLVEREVDQAKPVENLSFVELMSEVKKAGPAPIWWTG